ncbi:hypothetical protein [Sinorhizobium meliloti]|uniref:hypothetical protein n=1 Tax=Rhizobium meliloti TaxID=382 RepID=UPI003B519FD8
MIQIQDEQFHAMKPGAGAKEVDRIVREEILAAGLRDSYASPAIHSASPSLPAPVILPAFSWRTVTGSCSKTRFSTCTRQQVVWPSVKPSSLRPRAESA